jgi:transposase
VERREASLFGPRGLELLSGLRLEGQDKWVLDDLLQGNREIQAHIKTTDGAVAALYGELEEAARIDTVPGFATMLSVLVAVEIADISRFATPADLHACAGVIPSTRSSGNRTVHGPITKQGSSWLRWAELEAVYPAIKKDLALFAL